MQDAAKDAVAELRSEEGERTMERIREHSGPPDGGAAVVRRPLGAAACAGRESVLT
jgi:hypothetical protein